MYPFIIFLIIVVVVTILDVCPQIPKFYARLIQYKNRINIHHIEVSICLHVII